MRPAPWNTRRHGERNRGVIRGSLTTFGQVEALLVQRSTGYVIHGNGRIEELRRLGHKHVYVVRLDISNERAKALAIVMNRSAELAEWDVPALQAQLEELERDFDVEHVLGWTGDDVDALLKDASGEGVGVDDATAALQVDLERAEDTRPPDAENAAPRVVQPGDLWIFPTGHRLICGDSTDPRTWARLLPEGERAQVVHTDPPYGVKYEGSPREADAPRWNPIKNDDLEGDELARFLLSALRNLEHHAAPDAAFYVWHASTTRPDFEWALQRAGLQVRQTLHWIKPNATLSRMDYQEQVEPCLYAAKAGERPRWHAGRDQTTTWRVTVKARGTTAATLGNGLVITDGQGSEIYVQPRAPKRAKLRRIRLHDGEALELGQPTAETTAWEVKRDQGAHHPTQKPVELAARAIRNSSQPGDVVLDAFLGSGSTLIAAEVTGRRCYGVELDPTYCDRILNWYARLTGKVPVRAASPEGEVKPENRREQENEHLDETTRRRRSERGLTLNLDANEEPED